VSVPLSLPSTALSNPDFIADRTPRKILAVTLKESRAVNAWNTSTWPVIVKYQIDRHGTGAFRAIELQKPPVIRSLRKHSNISLVGDFKGRFVKQLVERAILTKR